MRDARVAVRHNQVPWIGVGKFPLDRAGRHGRLAMGAPAPRMLGQLVNPTPDFEERVFRPALERLFAGLVAERAAAPGR